jgi:cytochrome c-type biogenesis protein CcmF
VIPALGEFALWISLPIAIWGCVLAFLGGKWSRGDMVLSAERSTYAVAALLVVASIGIVVAFLTHQYQYSYVYNYSSRALLTSFKVTGLWAGQPGSLLFWALNLGLFSALAVWLNRKRNRDLMPYANGVLLAYIAFFIVLTLFVSPPYAQLGFTPQDGRGLNPQLQNYWMAIHPPTMYLGFTAFNVPFAFAIAALLVGKPDARWIQATRKWILTSWFFLTLAVIFGMRWAYEELGWGGYWFWDPVENASLLPWLVATAFLHSVMIQESRGMLKVWNMGLVILTFVMTIFATFLTRSGLIESVHSFAQNLTIAWIFLGVMGLTIAASVVLVLWRLPLLRSERQFESMLSRESAFLLNNLVLLGITFAVIWGTLFPLLTESLGSRVALGPEFFNQVNIPIGLVLLALMGIGPVIAWRKASPRNLRRNFLLPGAVLVATAAVMYVAGVRETYPLLTFALGAFVLTIIVVEFWKGTRARARIEEEGHFTALVHLVRRNRRRWGGYIVHVGIVIMFMGFAGSAYDREIRQSMAPGDTATIGSPFGHEYSLTYQGISTSVTPQARQAIALFLVEQDGRPLGTMVAQRELVTTNNPPQPISTVGIRSTLVEDLYVILATVEDGLLLGSNEPELQQATFQFLVNPLVPWIWYGGLIVAAGTLVGLWPGAGVPKRRGGAVGSASIGKASESSEPPATSGGVPATVG